MCTYVLRPPAIIFYHLPVSCAGLAACWLSYHKPCPVPPDACADSTFDHLLLRFAARAMLMRADIMLLDEPTNHLDVTNVAWLEKYLTGLEDVTSMIVSHDSGFLDNVCTDIIHYEDRKLKRYRVRTPLSRARAGCNPATSVQQRPCSPRALASRGSCLTLVANCPAATELLMRATEVMLPPESALGLSCKRCSSTSLF